MLKLFAIALLSGAVAIGCSGNIQAAPKNGNQQAKSTTATPSTEYGASGRNYAGGENGIPHNPTTPYESEATGGSVDGGGSNITASGTPGVPGGSHWNRSADQNHRNVTGGNNSNHGYSGSPAGTGEPAK
ncbi:MAG TPA: hypothetical protein VFP59_15980 [Candidatus Angelobacter sp.]|nr:hypothetical protein [Candidatus Angelobacter sp.]